MQPLLFLACGLMLVYTAYKTQKINALTVVLKMACSLAFLSIPVIGGALHSEWGYAHYVFIGLLLAFWGDLFLELKLLFPKHDARYSYLGFGSFILTHVFYVWAMMTAFQPSDQLWLLSILAGVGIVLFVVFTERPMGLNYGRFRPITLVYTFVLGGASVLALSLWWLQGDAAPAVMLLVLGMVLFLLSDLALSQLYFGPTRWVKSHIVVNCITYYLAQFLIAYSTLMALS